MRFIAQRPLSGEFLDWELPLIGPEVTRELSGPGGISATLSPEDARMVDNNGDLILDEWHAVVYAEASGLIRAGSIVVSSQFEGPDWRLVTAGFATYPHGIPYIGRFIEENVDPADVIREIWAHVQSQPDGDLGMVVDDVSTPVRLGAEVDDDGDPVPYELVWWDNKDCGAEINSLAEEASLDYVEEHAWNADKTDVTHRLRIGYPRFGRKRTDLRFAQDENIVDVVQPQRDGTVFANEAIGLGAGEGSEMVRARVPQRDGRLRRVVTVTDKTVRRRERMRAIARTGLRAARQIVEIPEITVHDWHGNAKYGSWQPGDDVLVEATVDWLGDVSIWHRVTADTWRPDEGTVTLKLKRSDSFTYGSL